MACFFVRVRIVSQERSSIWSWFLVHFVLNDDIYLQDFFFIFSKFWFFQVFQGSKRAVTKWQKILFVTLHISWAIPHIHICECHLWCIHKCKMISPCCIFIFRVVGVKGQKTVQNDRKFCPSCSISQNPYYIIVIYGTHL